METLPINVLLGTDVPELIQMLGGRAFGESRGNAMLVITHAQARQQREEESVIAEKEEDSGVLRSPVEYISED